MTTTLNWNNITAGATGYGYPDWALEMIKDKLSACGNGDVIVPVYLKLTVDHWANWLERMQHSQNGPELRENFANVIRGMLSVPGQQKQAVAAAKPDRPTDPDGPDPHAPDAQPTIQVRADEAEFTHLQVNVLSAWQRQQPDASFRVVVLMPVDPERGIAQHGILGQLPAPNDDDTVYQVRFTVLMCGQPLPQNLVSHFHQDGFESVKLPDLWPFPPVPSYPTIAAVIDDCVPYLSNRFQKFEAGQPPRTRILSTWLQTDMRQCNPPNPGFPGLGDVFDAADIDSMLHLDEFETYCRINAKLLPITERASSDHAVSHGAFVLEATTGADADDTTDPMRDTPVLAVQLPPTSIRDTSGQQNEVFAIWGLRWIIYRAVLAAFGNGKWPGNIVTSLTIGSLAGPGNEHAPFAEALTYEVDQYRWLFDRTQTSTCTEATSSALYLCCSYGNARREQLVARRMISKDEPLTIDWGIQPDDHSPSYLELRVQKDHAAHCKLILSCPDTAIAPLQLRFSDLPLQHKKLLPGAHRPIAGIYRLTDPSEFTALMVALAPTAQQDQCDVSPARAWRVEIVTDKKHKCLATARVQRSDTPAGYRLLGRQSWLNQHNSGQWDGETRDWTGTGNNFAICPISRQGTAVGHAMAAGGTVWFAGASYPAPEGAVDPRRPSLYSAEGADPGRPATNDHETDGPTCNALADDGRNMPGRRGSGVLSGSTARLSGTSVSAPALARWTLMVLNGATGPAFEPGTDLPSFLPTVLPPKDRRLGYGHVPGQVPFQSADRINI
ncbi:hypothetical protein FNJ84_01695 [Paracoccus sp. M683]|uniref:hypothetical protein n=1 Tax=Paracoccus sp. M683 TaxID=2594268 RepID=UPI00117CEDE7|nr:hypothetical protein [Paracoccus sp. M683]TRW99414.1 hypothetical protein FNJ84_01695 [Paracoccus sp. M683]